MSSPKIAVVMGSKSDWNTMQYATELLEQFGIAHHTQVISAHRTPDLLFQFAESARKKGFHAIIAGAGGAAHLPGMLASKTSLPVIGVPIQSKTLNGLDSLLSIVQMPGGVPVATMAIGEAGAKNAALMATAILATHDTKIQIALDQFRKAQTDAVLNDLYFEKGAK